jgi:hypothetical protein
VLLPGAADDHLILLWLAVGAWVGFASAHGAILERPSAPAGARGSVAQVCEGAALVAQYPWFRRHLAWRVLLLSVELAIRSMPSTPPACTTRARATCPRSWSRSRSAWC